MFEYLISLAVLTLPVPTLSSIDKGLNMTEIEVLQGESVALPCDIKTPRKQDRITLILWFKEDNSAPIYSVEVPENVDLAKLPRGSLWSSSKHFGNRANFTSSGKLLVRQLAVKESGTYRCRVDFTEAQTRSTFIHLQIVERVKSVKVVDSRGLERSTHAGPYLEGEALKLTCIALGGVPRPVVEWYMNRRKMETEIHYNDSSTSSELVISNLTRSDLHSEVSCRVNNNNISSSINVMLHVDINLLPTHAELSVENHEGVVGAGGVGAGSMGEMVVGRSYQVSCTVHGSRPPPRITWFINNTPIGDGGGNVTTDTNIARTTSFLIFKPELRSEGGVLKCKGVNTAINNSSFVAAKLPLNITYAPHVEIGLGKSISPNTVYEGGDVYFDCRVKAKPGYNRITWLHNDQELKQDVDNGVIFTNFSLVLQKITRERSGDYACKATNRIGGGESQNLFLDVKYVPVCISEQPMVYGVSKRELVNVLCEVEANPRDVEFRWTFNNTAEIIQVPKARQENNMSSSLLSYTPQTGMDYGTLMCTASNQVGIQKEPCVFHIIMAVTPDPVENCSVINKSSDSFHLHCLPGFDGGMNQTFHILVKESTTNIVKYDNSNLDTPDVKIHELSPGEAYLASVTSYNKKGTSVLKQLLVETLRLPDPQLVEEKLKDKHTSSGISWELGSGILAGSLLSLLLILVISLVLHRRCRRDGGVGGSHGRHRGSGSPGDTNYMLDNGHDPTMPSMSDSNCSNIHICTATSTPMTSAMAGNGQRTMSSSGVSQRMSSNTVAASLSMSMEQVTELGELEGVGGVGGGNGVGGHGCMSATASIHRKGILKKNLEGEPSECDKMRLLGSQSDLILNPPDAWSVMLQEDNDRPIVPLPPPAYKTLPARTMKSGLLPPVSPTHSAHSEGLRYLTNNGASPPPPPLLDSPLSNSGSLVKGLDTMSQCSHTLKKKKQESMV